MGSHPSKNHHDLLILEPELFHLSTKISVGRVKEPLSRGEIFKMEMAWTGNTLLLLGGPKSTEHDHHTECNIFLPRDEYF